MAARPGVLSFRVVDASLNECSTSYLVSVDGLSSVDTIADGMEAIGENFDVMLDGVVVDATLTIKVRMTGTKGAPIPPTSVAQTGRLVYDSGVPGNDIVFVLPAVAEDLLVGGKLNVLDSRITFWPFFVDDIHNGFVAISPANTSIGPLKWGYFSFRKKRRQTSKKSEA